MRRVIIAMLGVGAGFVALASWLGLDRYGSVLWIVAGVLLVGFPMLYCCCKLRWWEPWQLMTGGALGGVLCALPFIGGPFGPGFLLLIFALAGTLFGLLFWLAAIWRNDDLTCPKSFCLPCGAMYRVARNGLRRRDLM